MAKIAMLQYTYIFDPSKIWAHVDQFEETFAKYLQEHGLIGEWLDNIDPKGNKVMFIHPNPKPQQMGEKHDAQTAQQRNIRKQEE